MMKYYVYRHIRLDTNEVFYVGLGTTRKIIKFEGCYRRAFTKQNRNKHWNNIVNLTDYKVEIIFESNDREEIIEKEKEFIILYGRRDLGEGTLVNFTNGGEGTGRIISQEQRDKISKANKGKKGWNTGMIMSEEHRKMLSLAHKGQEPWIKGKKHSKETKKKMSEARKGKYIGENSPSYGRKTSLEELKKLGTPVSQYDLEGNFIQEFYSITEAAKQTNSTLSLISKVCVGKRDTHNGFKWRYSTDKNRVKK